MSKSPGTPITSTAAPDTQSSSSPSEQAKGTSYSSQTSSAGSSVYSTSSSSSRQHLSSGNTSPPSTIPLTSSSIGHKGNAEEKLHFSPASRGITQQSLEIESGHPSDWQTDIFKNRPLDFRNSESGSGGGSSGRKAIDPMMQSAHFTTAPASSSSSTAQNQHPHDILRDDSRGSALRQYSEEEGSSSHSFNKGQSNGQQRPASKARRTSSGGSRVPGEQQIGLGGSSASDNGSDWPHAPKTHNQIVSGTASPNVTSIKTKLSEDDKAAASTSSDHTVGAGKRPERASTSSSYFTKAAAAAAAAAAATNSGADRKSLDGQDPTQPHLDLAKYPPQDLLRVLATLLAQIAAANDQLRPKGGNSNVTEEGKHRRKDLNTGQEPSVTASNSSGSIPSPRRGRKEGSNSSATGTTLNTSSPTRHAHPTTAALSALTTPSSTLCFHARNVPSISIESYLLRILKYCPATNEVFLSLLIYFDRMSKMGASSSSSPSLSRSASTTSAVDLANRSETGAGKAVEEDIEEDEEETHAGMRGFAIDSYNVHRLVIAGVTVASKFFSDVFYTNSRYAKVGGLPVHELNQLELQFLLLNDFKLVIPLDEMQRYADQLLVYGGVPRSTWSDAEGNSSTIDAASHGSDRAASEAVIRQQEQQDVQMPDA